MALVAVASAKGAPGATTLAVALAAVHPGPSLVADVDPAGGDLVWRCTGVDGRPLETGRGLLSLAAVVRHGRADLVPHLQTIVGGLPVLAGVMAPEQVTGLGPVWPQLAHALASVSGADVFADCGRVAAGSPAMPVLLAAEAVVLVTRAEVEALAHLRERVRVLAEATGAGTVRPAVGVVVVAPEKDHRPVVGDVQRLLDAAGLAGRVLGAVAWDERGARLLAGTGRGSAGKTTLLRALANEIPPAERLITVERALELGLGQFRDLHPNVVAMEERLPNSEGAGAIGMAELVRRSLRMNPSRVIVGEVLGDEIVTMLNAMSQGNNGSLSTIHANSSLEVFNRIATYAIQSVERLPQDATMMLIAGAIDFVVFVERRNDYAHGGGLRRIVTSVREVNGVDGRVLSSEVFAAGADGRAVAGAPVSCLEELVAAGYRPAVGAGWSG